MRHSGLVLVEMPELAAKDEVDDEAVDGKAEASVLLALMEGKGAIGAIAVCNTGFCTWVDLTDCIITGDCDLACRALRACN